MHILGTMQKWEYKVFASHLDPAELVLILNESGCEGWELVALTAVVDYQPVEVVDPVVLTQPATEAEAEEFVPIEAFRYIFKRPLKVGP